MSEGATITPGDAQTPAESSAVEQSILGMRKRCLLIAGGAFVATVLGLVVPLMGDSTFSGMLYQAFQAYTLAFIYVFGFAMGCLALNLLHNVTGGAWGFSIKRILIAGMRTIPFLGLAFLPLLAAAWSGNYYPWTTEAAEDDHILQHKAIYLNLKFWSVRAVVFFVIWIGMASVLIRKWKRYEESGFDAWNGRQMRRLSAPLLIVYVLTVTFAAFDWVMSLEPLWFSTMYGALFCVGQALTVFAFGLVVTNWLSRRAPVFASHYEKKQFHDVSALMFAFIVLWTYMSFAQFLIIWSGHLPEETPWYMSRTRGGWQGLMGCLALFHFLVPFLLLLRLKWKKSAPFLYWCAGAMLLMRLVDLFWNIKPAFGDPLHPQLSMSVMDLSLPVMMLSFWLALFANRLRQGPLMVLENGSLKAAFEEPPTPLNAKMASR